MRILIISNFYPPYDLGGWEQNSKELVSIFRNHGHAVEVITSNYGVQAGEEAEPGIHRVFCLESEPDYYKVKEFFLHWQRNFANNLKHLERIHNQFRPEIIFIHSMWDLSPAIPWLAERLNPGRVVYQMFGDWPYTESVHDQYWQSGVNRSYMQIPKQILGAFAAARLADAPTPAQLEFRHVLSVSQAIRQEMIDNTHVEAGNVHVIHNGIDPQPFLQNSRLNRASTNGHTARILYAGGLYEHKAVHTLVEAFALLKETQAGQRATLTILGDGHPDYVTQLKERVRAANIQPDVYFKPRMPRKELPEILGKHDIFVLPSLREPMARMLQEAMAAGLAVVGTFTGGTGETIDHEINGLTFPPEDAGALAQQLSRLVSEPELSKKLGERACQTVLERFTLERMASETEAYLQSVIAEDERQTVTV
jgi:glycosyltransferase involved in cell wall biosynthesis